MIVRLYRLISTLLFLWRYRLRPRKGHQTLTVGLGTLRHHYLHDYHPFFKCDELEAFKAFSRWLPYKVEGGGGEDDPMSGDFTFTISDIHAVKIFPNSEESRTILDKYDLIPPLH